LLHPSANIDDIIRFLATHSATFLEEALSEVAPQARLIFGQATVDGFPTTSSRLSELMGLTSNVVAAQLKRLENSHLLRADKAVGRNRKYDPVDPVLAMIYRASICEATTAKSRPSSKRHTEPA
jgi:hypothetical protein